MIIKIQSVSDIITNSSSEVFTVRTGGCVETVREWFDSCLRIWGYEDLMNDWSIRGNIYESRPGEITISYGVMCNVNESIEDLLISQFGEENVKAYYD